MQMGMNENYYSKEAWEYGPALIRAREALDSFCFTNTSHKVNEILELYNVYLLITGHTKHSHLFDASKYNAIEKEIIKCVALFFKGINADNIRIYADDCYHEFWTDYWDLIVKFKVYDKIERFPWVAEACNLPLYNILQYKEVVNDLDTELSQYMRESDQTARTLIDYYLRKHADATKLYVPKSFSARDKKECVSKYLSGDDINANLLTLIIEAPKNMQEFPIDDRMKISAEKRIRDIFDGKTHNVVIHTPSTGASVSFQENVSDVVHQRFDRGNIELIYDINWIRENLDYPTLLNNFIYMFGYVDLCMRWQHTEKASGRGAIEDTFIVKGVRSYISGQTFRTINTLATMQMAGYYDVLSKQGIALEEVIKWFFEDYLAMEFSASGFVCNVPRASDSYLAKCKLMVSAMDGVAKQYRMYLEDGYIDRELYERSSEHMFYEKLGSFLSCKYIYCGDNRLAEAQRLLFSDQSHITYTPKTKGKYDTFVKMVSAEEMHKDDFHDFQWAEIEKLLALNAVRIEDDIVRLNNEVVKPLYELYNQEVICYQYRKNETLDKWIEESLVEVGVSLFSRGEADYINYMLNQSEFSNGKDLRNKYIHDSCPKDEQIQRHDYFEILKIMILMIIKMNEEFCLKDFSVVKSSSENKLGSPR